ncbi:MAG TPA: hypothetical protein VMX55_03065 [candidate division Zixibacteria bacterium]|nr:hypothetical protein [candidate division Zixibacteria bacterium]
MDLNSLLGKIAADKESHKLGKIIRIERLLGKTIKKYKPYAMILVNRRFRKDLIVPIELEKVTKVEGIYAWFNITKDEFNTEVERISDTKIEREIYHGDTGVYSYGGRGHRYDDYLNLSHTRKERKR